jgi:hypothetical protein
MNPNEGAVGVEIDSGNGPTTSTPGSVMILADEGQPDVHLALGECGHRAGAALRKLDLGLHLFGNAELLHGLVEAYAGRRRRLSDLGRRSTSPTEATSSPRRVSKCPVRCAGRTATPTATWASGVSVLATTFPDANTSG